MNRRQDNNQYFVETAIYRVFVMICRGFIAGLFHSRHNPPGTEVPGS
jgi:hypothetical protein